MTPLYIGLMAVFITGAFGYMGLRFIIMPALKYKKAKKQVLSAIRIYMNAIRNEADELEARKSMDEPVNAIKKSSNSLMECYEQVLPRWYRLLLKSRRESPMDAVKHMLVLANTRAYAHAMTRVKKIKDALRIY